MAELASVFGMPGAVRITDAPDIERGGALRTLIERAQDGDRQAFDQIIVCFERRVVSTAWRILDNQADAFDAAQDVFIRLHRYLRTFRTDEDFSAWLYRLILNACHDTRRRRPAHLSFDAERERGALAALRSTDDVEAAAIHQEDQAMVARALATLSEKERMALVLRDLEGLSSDEVARILGSSPTTVRSQISTARAKMRLFRDRLARQEESR